MVVGGGAFCTPMYSLYPMVHLANLKDPLYLIVSFFAGKLRQVKRQVSDWLFRVCVSDTNRILRPAAVKS